MDVLVKMLTGNRREALSVQHPRALKPVGREGEGVVDAVELVDEVDVEVEVVVMDVVDAVDVEVETTAFPIFFAPQMFMFFVPAFVALFIQHMF
jgi:hypothetical protein